MEELSRFYMEIEDRQEPREPEEMEEGGENEFCFAIASVFVVASMVLGIFSAYNVSQESNIVLAALVLAASFTILIASLCWAIYFGKGGYTPGAIGAANVLRLKQQGGENPIRLTGREGSDVNVEVPSSSQPAESHTPREHSSPNLESGEEATSLESCSAEVRKNIKAAVSHALEKMAESDSPTHRHRPRRRTKSSRAKRGCDIDVEEPSTVDLTDPAASGPSCLQPPESHAPVEHSRVAKNDRSAPKQTKPVEHSSRNLETAETATGSKTLKSEEQSIRKASPAKQSGSGGSIPFRFNFGSTDRF